MTKKALLVISFGTSYAGTRERTIGAIERYLAEHFPDREVFSAWTSGFLIRKVARDEGLIVETPLEAMQRLAGAGFTDLLVQPTHLSDGYENQRMMEIVREYAGQFERVATGRPLLAAAEDRRALAQLMPKLYLGDSDAAGEAGTACSGADDDACSGGKAGGSSDACSGGVRAVADNPAGDGGALLLMGHGSAKHPVPVYGQLQEAFFDAGMDNVFVGTVEGTPTFEEALRRLAGSGYRRVALAPLMIVAGDHAVNDLAGDGPSSWQSRLRAAGYETRAVLRGLGEYAEIQELFAQHAQEAELV